MRTKYFFLTIFNIFLIVIKCMMCTKYKVNFFKRLLKINYLIRNQSLLNRANMNNDDIRTISVDFFVKLAGIINVVRAGAWSCSNQVVSVHNSGFLRRIDHIQITVWPVERNAYHLVQARKTKSKRFSFTINIHSTDQLRVTGKSPLH